MGRLGAWLSGEDRDGHCGCEPTVADGRLVLDADGCEGAGRLDVSSGCRETAVRALVGEEAATVVTRSRGFERQYAGRGGALLVAAGRFAGRVRRHDDRLADRSCRDPLAAAREAVGRAGVVADLAAETGLAAVADGIDGGYEGAFQPRTGPTVSHWRLRERLPDGRLAEVYDLDTGAEVRRYGGPGTDRQYHLLPAGQQLDRQATAGVAEAADRLADRSAGSGAPRAAAAGAVSTETAAAVLEKHTEGYGLLADFFADPAVSDVFLTPPVASNPARIVVDGRAMATNAWLTEPGAAALASRFRGESGRPFSRAAPTLDATVEIRDRRVRVAAVRPPASEGLSFAFRAHDRDPWRLGDLVANGTVTPAAAALLSLAVERGRSLLLAGARGAGKTTALGALLWELPPAVRTVVLEDTPELPVAALQAAGRDVQPLYTGTDGGELPPTEALRAALRLGDGALAVGEVRGEEAEVLYEAMRVGANSEAVLGTIHGDGAEAVYRRVVEDLGVSPAAFGATDAVVTLEAGPEGRRIRSVEEVVGGDNPGFEPLYRCADGRLEATGRIDRGNSRLVAALAQASGSYESARRTLADRTERFAANAPSPPRDRTQ
jgi:type IV secretory pathway ATPase VirB11/archaellum biosynthesis ATPase